MKARQVPWLLTATLVAGVLGAAWSDPPSRASSIVRPPDPRAARLAESYDRWRDARHPDPSQYVIRVPLSWFRGLSAERSDAKGLAVIDLVAGTVTVELDGIDLESLADVWLIDNRRADKASAAPDATDVMHRVGSLRVDGGHGALRAELGTVMFRDFDVDQVVVARRDEGPVRGGVLYGSLPLFERLHRVSWRVAQDLAPFAADEGSRHGPFGAFPAPGRETAGSSGALASLAGLLEEGEDLFDNETFDGNGRSCTTCHPADNNFTLDRPYIDRLPPDDPLFVAEFIDELNHELNGGLYFENPVLMRKFAVIVENPDGFDDLANTFVLRAPNHLQALALSIEPAASDCSTVPPVDRLGWGGDGAPGSGSLREFATIAVISHMPLTLGRVAGVDFRLPTDTELDALEAFMLSLGRQEELDLDHMEFTDPDVLEGLDLFNRTDGGGKCFLCHGNAGALRHPTQTSPLQNMQFDVGISGVRHPGELLGEPMPFDDGFGTGPFPPVIDRCFNSFSTPSLIEAADTGPFFHNHVFQTLEGAIGHYSSVEFNVFSHAGKIAARHSPPVDLTNLENDQIGALLRVLNALQNIDNVTICDARVLAAVGLAEARRLLRLCIADNQDAITVLSESGLDSLHPIAQTHLAASLGFHRQALQTSDPAARDAALAAAAVELSAARADMVAENP